MSECLKELESANPSSSVEDMGDMEECPSFTLRSAGFYVDEPRDPLWNMSCDNWMATSAQLSTGTGLFRVYRWNPAGLTIGANQRWERALDLSALSAGEIAVRRITGGRAIYHDTEEVTYAVAIELEELGPATVNAVSRCIAGGIMRFLEAQGLTPEITSSRRASPLHRGQSSRHCFGSLTRDEITVGGQKVAAGAQRVFASPYFRNASLKLAGLKPHPALYGLSPGHCPQQKAPLPDGAADEQALDGRAKLLSLSGFLAEAFGVERELVEWTPEMEEEISRSISMLEIRTGVEGAQVSRAVDTI